MFFISEMHSSNAIFVSIFPPQLGPTHSFFNIKSAMSARCNLEQPLLRCQNIGTLLFMFTNRSYHIMILTQSYNQEGIDTYLDP